MYDRYASVSSSTHAAIRENKNSFSLILILFCFGKKKGLMSSKSNERAEHRMNELLILRNKYASRGRVDILKR